jgi:hypothetical protein
LEVTEAEARITHVFISNPYTFLIFWKGHTISCYRMNLEVSTNPRKNGVRSLWGSFLHSYLDNKIHVALVFVTGDRSVWPDDQAAINSGREVDMFAWRP